MSDDARTLHRIIDRRIDRRLGAGLPIELARGSVTEVDATQRQIAARLDGAVKATRGIATPSGMSPVVGDDVVVLRRRDGFLLLHAILGRA